MLLAAIILAVHVYIAVEVCSLSRQLRRETGTFPGLTAEFDALEVTPMPPLSLPARPLLRPAAPTRELRLAA